MVCDYTVADIEDELSLLVNSSSNRIGEIFMLTEILDCDEASDRVKISRIIQMIRRVFRDRAEADLLLVALNLLSVEYRDYPVLGARFEAYSDLELYHEELASPESTLHKRARKLIKRLADWICKTVTQADTQADVISKLLGKNVATDETEDAWREDISDIDRVIREILEQSSEKLCDEAAGGNRAAQVNLPSSVGISFSQIITVARPLQPSGFFIGRDAKLAEIKKQLVGNAKLLLLNGMGGIGKTEMCRKLFYDAINNGLPEITRVGWITFNGNLEQSFFRQFSEIERPADKAGEYFEQAGRYINSLGGALLLFVDNANDISTQDTEWLLKLGCKIVLTSRNERIERMMPIEIERLCMEDCRILYRWHSKTGAPGTDSYYGFSSAPDSSPDEDLDGILELSKRHTLAVELLAKTQRASGQTTKQMRTLLEQSGFSLEGISESISYRHNPEMSATSKTTDKNEEIFIAQFSKVFSIAAISGEKLRVMRLFSLLAAEPVETAMVKQWISLPDLDAINSLVNSGWIVSGEFLMQGAESDRRFGFSMHPLISSVVRHQAMPDYSLSRILVAAMTETVTLEKEEEFLTKVPYLNHANSVIDFTAADEEGYVELITKTSVILFNIPLLVRAADILTRAVTIADRAFPSDSLVRAGSYHNLAYVRFLQKDFESSLTLGKTALNIRKQGLGLQAVPTAQTINNLGRAYDGKCDFPAAMECFEEATGILNAILGENDPVTVHLSNNIGVTYFHMGEYDQAYTFFKKVLDSLVVSLGETHADTARAYHNVSSAAYCLGKYGEALPTAIKSHDLYEQALGKEHNYVAEITHNIACMYEEAGDLEEALQWHEKAIRIREKIFGEDSPDTAESYSGMASVLTSLKRYDEALPYYKKALDINESKLGDTNDDTGETCNGLADLYCEMGDFAEALRYVDRAINIYMGTLGREHPYTAEALNSKGGIYYRMQDYMQAMQFYTEALNIRRDALGEHPTTAESIFNVGKTLVMQGKFEDGLRDQLVALRIFRREYDSDDHPKVHLVFESIHEAYLASGRDEADYAGWLCDNLK